MTVVADGVAGRGATGVVVEQIGSRRVVAVDTPAGLRERADAWDRLVRCCEHRVHALSYAWVSSHLERLLEPGQSWTCLFAYDGEALVGVLPLVATPGHLAGLSAPSLATPHGLHTHSVDIACAASSAAEVVPLLFRAVERCFPGWSEARLPRLSELSPTLRCLPAAARVVRAASEIGDEGCFVRTDGALPAYLDGLSPNFVRNVARVTRKFERLPGHEIVFLGGPAAAPRFLDEFVALEAAGWKGAAGGAIASRAQLRDFYAMLVQRLHDSGSLEWHFLRAEGQTLAAHFACRIDRCLYLWKITFNESYGPYAPGNILMMRTLERAFADPDVDEVNCVTRTPWNAKWNMSVRTYHDVVVWPRRALPFVAGYLPHQARRWVRDAPGVKPLYHRVLGLRDRLLGVQGRPSAAAASPERHEGPAAAPAEEAPAVAAPLRSTAG